MVLLLYIVLFLPSCYSIKNGKLGVHPTITIGELEQDLADDVDGCFYRETISKFEKLEEIGFLGDQIPNNDNILTSDHVRRHFMFLFFNCLILKEPGRLFQNAQERDEFVDDFRRIPGNGMLLWEPIPVNKRPWRDRPARYLVEFRIKDIFLNFYDFPPGNNLGNLNIFEFAVAEAGRAPQYMNDTVDIDHLFRDNSITIELPSFIHAEKTMFIDNLIRVNIENLIRTSRNYWLNRTRQ
ncbi:hypothetical protein [Cardinium endosymbiont of Dermatophagoides farinae]|uniref:hypothetical protein n=1 Tax=Cardinium endosymbiont of Dermatophagoides farinae TaxID=2597823 RepID=UPI0011833AED|nr:hypothetical protein [Cardinium endosymbiont of Dermatophagoides farinae]